MSAKKALEVLTTLIKEFGVTLDPDLRKAILLGIQSLRRHWSRHSCTYEGLLQLLPGETEE